MSGERLDESKGRPDSSALSVDITTGPRLTAHRSALTRALDSRQQSDRALNQ